MPYFDQHEVKACLFINHSQQQIQNLRLVRSSCVDLYSDSKNAKKPSNVENEEYV